jgi:uncharacterized protein (DUF2235 family)
VTASVLVGQRRRCRNSVSAGPVWARAVEHGATAPPVFDCGFGAFRSQYPCVSRGGSAAPKNILVFSDGTGQARGLVPDQRITNVYKLYRATRCGPDTNIDPSKQLAYYDPGIGSAASGADIKIGWARWVYNLVCQATGLGITANIVDCYAAIVRMYEPGDRIFLFGLRQQSTCCGADLARASQVFSLISRFSRPIARFAYGG